ncbi:olfactory receptor 5H19-like [Brachyhypopomus gauderio]|uniref:olfactory receptor 5H19-like n=1 Tax=Brachyhypopomus gauderio TaxID=698409 RepID=UPI00404224B4
MENETFRYHTLSIEGLKVTPQSEYPAFIILLLMYNFTVVSNVTLIILISVEKSLHEPMHILFCNLPLNDVLGISLVVPSILKDIFKDASDRHITYTECVIQAYLSHLFATTCHTILMIGLTVRLSHCSSVIQNPTCDNASLFKLSCDDITINNIYGLAFTVVLLVSSLGSILITYLKIAFVCLKSKNKQMNKKAIKTCSTHLAVYVIMTVCGNAIVFLHRFPQLSEQRKLASIMFNVVPPFLNPIIYGVQTKELRNKIVHFFRGK